MPDGAYNPLFIYKGVGLENTFNARFRNKLQEDDPSKKLFMYILKDLTVIWLNLQLGAINEFKIFIELLMHY